jgi:hypothetical protein
MTPMARIIGALLPLLLATSARAIELHFEAWPTASGETCVAPCYQMRMFLQVNPWDPHQQINSLLMDIDIQSGAVPAQLPVFPARDDNAGPGNVHTRFNANLPWNLSSAVAKSPTEGFHALMVHAARTAFTVQGLADLVDDPSTNCADLDKCGFVEEALAQHRVYLGFINVTRAGSPSTDGQPHDDPIFGADTPQGVPFFVVRVGNLTGTGDAVEAAGDLVRSGGTGWIPFLPEPSPALLLVAALAAMVELRRTYRP